MGMVTGTPIGTLDVQESLYVYSTQNIYMQESTATP